MYRYDLTEVTELGAENGARKAYGIRVSDGGGNVIKSYDGVFTDKSKAEALVSSCNEGMLSDVHLENVIEDALFFI